jgi:NAD(P)-dependent dehydrogenase (short-subunit alcohol dehydrogenase family)
MLLKGQVAIVTGGGGGIGEGISLCLAKAGVNVVVSDINEALAKNVATKVEEMGRQALAIKTDVRSEAQCQAMVALTLEQMGRLDILVCSAGTAGTQFMPVSENAANLENIPLEVWDITMGVNLKGLFLSNRAVIPHFKKQNKGKIINISSDAGRQGGELLPIYSASKAGVINLSQSIAIQLAPYNVNVNTICPGFIWTPLWAEGMDFMTKARPEMKDVVPEDAWKAIVDTVTPFKRAQTAEDIGNLAVFLASDLSREITGQAINVDGGFRLN